MQCSRSENPPKTNANATVAKHSQVEPTYTATLRHTHNQRGYIELSVAKQQTERSSLIKTYTHTHTAVIVVLSYLCFFCFVWFLVYASFCVNVIVVAVCLVGISVGVSSKHWARTTTSATTPYLLEHIDGANLSIND